MLFGGMLMVKQAMLFGSMLIISWITLYIAHITVWLGGIIFDGMEWKFVDFFREISVNFHCFHQSIPTNLN